MKREPKIDTAPQPVQPQPAVEWKPIAETMEELKELATQNARLDVLWPSGEIISVGATCVLRWTSAEATGFHWTIIPRPKLAPTVEELERAVVEAAVQLVQNMPSNDVLPKNSIGAVIRSEVLALLAARENAAKGGGE